MFLSDRVWRAIEHSAKWHAGQKRKVSELPYIVHPYAVGFLLAHYTDNEDVVIAGLLHDILEDVPGMTRSKIAAEFGESVASIVAEVTEDRSVKVTGLIFGRAARWRKIKEEYLRRLADDSEAALMVAAADKICNLRSFLSEYPQHAEGFWKKYGRSEGEFLWIVQASNAVIQHQLHHPLADELNQISAQVFELLTHHSV